MILEEGEHRNRITAPPIGRTEPNRVVGGEVRNRRLDFAALPRSALFARDVGHRAVGFGVGFDEFELEPVALRFLGDPARELFGRARAAVYDYDRLRFGRANGGHRERRSARGGETKEISALHETSSQKNSDCPWGLTVGRTENFPPMIFPHVFPCEKGMIRKFMPQNSIEGNSFFIRQQTPSHANGRGLSSFFRDS
jgi:hypothetical protein